MTAKYGLTSQQFALLENIVIQPLKAAGAEVFLFGSRARGAHHPHSDVDLVYRLPAGVRIPLNQIGTIKEAIEESRFPFLVDLVDENDLPVAYRDTVVKTKVPL